MNNDPSPRDEGIRINKYLASCGFESRRNADKLIKQGRVAINGKVVDSPGVRVLPGDFVKVDGHRAEPREPITILLNKPRGYICSRLRQTPEKTVYDLLPPKYRHVNYVGRLDVDSEGLLLLTNKGDLGNKIAHPHLGVEKEYWVTVDQPLRNRALIQLLKGVRIPEGQVKAKYISRLSPRRASIVIEQGLKRQIRQMLACLGYRVRKLVRVRIGSLWGGDLMPGHVTVLTPEQERLALTNPSKRRKGLVGYAQAFPSSETTISAEQLRSELDEKAARRAIEEEAHYRFNPADFETEQEAEENTFNQGARQNRKRVSHDEHRTSAGNNVSPERTPFRKRRTTQFTDKRGVGGRKSSSPSARPRSRSPRHTTH